MSINALTPGFCNNVPNAAPYIQCYSGVAQAVNDYTLCEQATRMYAVTLIYSSSDLCIKDFAIDKADSTACNYIIDDNLSQQCQNAIR